MKNKPTEDRLADLFSEAKRFNVKAKDLAAEIGIAESTLSRWKLPDRSPRAKLLDAAELALARIIKNIRGGRV